MKSLISIVRKLTEHEIESFRTFLNRHGKSNKNKKLDLFNELVVQSQQNGPLFGHADKKERSRQSAYQLKKRLQEELYSFLISQQQDNNGNDTLFLEMECHKKLYCFKILYDKGVHAHAYQILEKVLNIASKNALHTIYLETLTLKNVYFPLTRSAWKRKIPVSVQITNLRKNISRNLYINQYLSHSLTMSFESDISFRRKLINEMTTPDEYGDEHIVARLMEVNHHLFQCHFTASYGILKDLLPSESGKLEDAAMLALIYTELIKVSMCLQLTDETAKWVAMADELIRSSDPFIPVLMELSFIHHMRSGNTDAADSVLHKASQYKQIAENESTSTRWLFYGMFLSLQKKEYSKVIKAANADAIYSLKEKSWLIIARILEIFSIYEIRDFDWLFYKIENLRKTVATTGDSYPRLSQLTVCIKNHLRERIHDSTVSEGLRQIEIQYPWHPLTNELLNLCDHLRLLVTAARPALTVA